MGGNTREVNIAFHGVRGSTPCCCPTLQRYGGNTSCVSIEAEAVSYTHLTLPTTNRW